MGWHPQQKITLSMIRAIVYKQETLRASSHEWAVECVTHQAALKAFRTLRDAKVWAKQHRITLARAPKCDAV
jgi:hypothetical protein